jgi:hypothetical protein
MVTRLIPVFSFALLFASCTATEVPLSHDNPLDRVFDSGDFRLGLTSQAKPNGASLSWSNVYHKTEGALSDSNLKLNATASILRSATIPSTQDQNSVKNASTLSAGFSAVSACPVAAANASYAGTCDVSASGYYIIQFNYKFTNKSGVVTSGILYSNFVAVQ